MKTKAHNELMEVVKKAIRTRTLKARKHKTINLTTKRKLELH
jgi:hypothetical protein